jgi:Na+/H+ antiporter NhaD/arsenite permease-like protein
VLGLLAVPVFKAVTHLPPFMGMLFSLSVIWLVSELMDRKVEQAESSTGVVTVLTRIDLPSLLFFLGILLAVGALGSSGLLREMAELLDRTVGDHTAVAVLIGLVSAVVDNVPLVAAGMDMYALPNGHAFWLLLAYCAGTGGSCLIIGSAAGVAAMGLEKIDFVWYMTRVGPLALLGYLSGVAAYVLL